MSNPLFEFSVTSFPNGLNPHSNHTQHSKQSQRVFSNIDTDCCAR